MKRQRRAHRRKYLPRQSASINGSYDFVPQSYDLAARRLDSIERRINNSLIFFVTATFAIGGALLAVAPESANIKFGHPYFLLMVTMFLIAVAIGILSNLDDDRLAFINPQILYQKNRFDTMLEFPEENRRDLGARLRNKQVYRYQEKKRPNGNEFGVRLGVTVWILVGSNDLWSLS